MGKISRTPTRSSTRLQGEKKNHPPLLEVANQPVAPNNAYIMDGSTGGQSVATERAPEHHQIQEQQPAPAINVDRARVDPLANTDAPTGNPGQILTNQMAQNFEALFRALNLQPPIPLPSYEGADHEDPQRFVRQCEEYFAHTHTPPASRTSTAATGLRGDAERWWSCYSPLDFDWERFQELLYNRYNSPAVISRLNAQLFSRKQTERETVGIYLQQKYLLYQRLRDTDPEPTKVCTLLELLRPSLRMAIRPSNPQTLAALMTRAMEAEYDLGDPQQGTPKSKKEDPKPEKAPNPTRPPTRDLPQCWHCPGKHYHKDCPVLAQRQADQARNHQGNAGRAVEVPNPAANQN